MLDASSAMEQKKPALHLLMLLLFLSCLFSLAATARLSKSLASTNQATLAIDEAGQVGNVEESIEEKFVEGRMEYESLDYPGSGANNRHDPRGPGRH